MPDIVLKRERERSLKRHHPWIFSGAIERVEGAATAGDTVRVRSADGEWLGVGAYNPQSNIRVRLWDWHAETAIDDDFFGQRVQAAAALRAALIAVDQGGAVRLVHGESDGLPGLIADRYGEVVVMQTTSAGARRWRTAIGAALGTLDGVSTVIEKSDGDVLALEGLAPVHELVSGRALPATLSAREHHLAYTIPLAGAHKTGLYLDQRDNRALIGRLARERRVLDGFCYAGGFALNALAGGAREVVAVDSSAAALARASDLCALNRLDGARLRVVEADMFKYLRSLRDARERFDLIVLDPPKFAPTAQAAERAARGYKDINLLAFKLLARGGLLATFSCSGGVDVTLFRKIVAGAAQDAGVDARIVQQLHAAPDHPIALAFPEGEYLKGLLCRID